MNYRPILANFFTAWVCIAGGGSLLAQEKPITLHEAVEGMAPNLALKTAYASLDGAVMAQAGILSYMDVFLYLGLLFLICIPFILMVRNSSGQPAAAAGMH
jgi:MFS transporter, DHA2 family, multidrug resistance protein